MSSENNCVWDPFERPSQNRKWKGCSTLGPDTSPSHAGSVCCQPRCSSDNSTLISRVDLSPRDGNRQKRHVKDGGRDKRREAGNKKTKTCFCETHIPSRIKICDSFYPLPPRSDTCVLPASALCVCVCVCAFYTWECENLIREMRSTLTLFSKN